jgi:hypothetical protein
VVARRAVRPAPAGRRARAPDLPAGLRPLSLPQDRGRRSDACACYATQLGFQFGGEAGMRAALQDWPELLLADPDAAAVVQRGAAAVGQ